MTADLACVSNRVARGGDVGERVVDAGFRLELASLGDVLGRVTQVDIRGVAIEQRRCDRHVAVRGVAVADAANVAVHPEDLLGDDDGAPRRGGGVRAPCRDARAVGGREFDELAHGDSPSVRSEIAEDNVDVADRDRQKHERERDLQIFDEPEGDACPLR